MSATKNAHDWYCEEHGIHDLLLQLAYKLGIIEYKGVRK